MALALGRVTCTKISFRIWLAQREPRLDIAKLKISTSATTEAALTPQETTCYLPSPDKIPEEASAPKFAEQVHRLASSEATGTSSDFATGLRLSSSQLHTPALARAASHSSGLATTSTAVERSLRSMPTRDGTAANMVCERTTPPQSIPKRWPTLKKVFELSKHKACFCMWFHTP